MIEKTSAYKTSDGHTHLTLEDAQIHALQQIGIEGGPLLKSKTEVLAILKLKPRKVKSSKAKAPKETKLKAPLVAA